MLFDKIQGQMVSTEHINCDSYALMSLTIDDTRIPILEGKFLVVPGYESCPGIYFKVSGSVEVNSLLEFWSHKAGSLVVHARYIKDCNSHLYTGERELHLYTGERELCRQVYIVENNQSYHLVYFN